MKRSRAGLLVAGFAFVLSALTAGRVPAQSDDLVAAATKEGSVTVYLQTGYKDGLQQALDQWAKLYPNLESIAINGQRPAKQDVHDGERDKLFWKMERPVVIGAVCHCRFEPERLVIGTD